MYLKHYYIRLNISQTTIEPDQRSEGGDEYRYKVQGSYLHNDNWKGWSAEIFKGAPFFHSDLSFLNSFYTV